MPEFTLKPVVDLLESSGYHVEMAEEAWKSKTPADVFHKEKQIRAILLRITAGKEESPYSGTNTARNR